MVSTIAVKYGSRDCTSSSGVECSSATSAKFVMWENMMHSIVFHRQHLAVVLHDLVDDFLRARTAGRCP